MISTIESMSFDASAIVLGLFCIIFLIINRRFHTRHTVLFLTIMLVLVFSATADLWTGALEYLGLTLRRLPETIAWETHYFFFHSLLGVLVMLYVMSVNGSIRNKPRWWKILLCIPTIAQEVFILLNPIHNRVFYYDAAGHFTRGDLEIVIYVINAVYVLGGIINLIRYREAVTPRVLYSMIYFFIAAMVGVSIQFFFQEMKVELFAEVMALLGTMMVIENTESARDPEANALTRNAFLIDLTRLIETNTHFHIVAVRIKNLDLYARILPQKNQKTLIQSVNGFLSRLARRLDVYYIRRGVFVCIFFCQDDEVKANTEKIRERFSDGWVVGDMSVVFDAVLAEAAIPQDIKNQDEIISLLDADFDKAGAGVQILAGEDFAYLSREKDVENALRHALSEGSLRVFYQPIWNSKTHKITTAEALVRMITPELGFVSPAEFIPVAESSGLINELGKFVFEESCRLYAENHLEELGIEYIEVNMSIYQLMKNGLQNDFEEILARYHLTPDRINLEITETADLEGSDDVIENIRELQEFGFGFSMDDFGTGYSNLSDAMKKRYKNLKMDISLLRDADNDVNSRLLLSNLIWSFGSMGYQVVQEGVEDKKQLEFVVRAGANLIQGYYFSKPLPPQEFLEYIRNFEEHCPDLSGIPEAISISGA